MSAPLGEFEQLILLALMHKRSEAESHPAADADPVVDNV